MIATILDYLSRHLRVVAIVVLTTAIGLFSITSAFPLTFKMSRCEIRDSTFALHEITYRLSTVTQTEGGAIVRLCIREVVRTKQSNFVELAK